MTILYPGRFSLKKIIEVFKIDLLTVNQGKKNKYDLIKSQTRTKTTGKKHNNIIFLKHVEESSVV